MRVKISRDISVEVQIPLILLLFTFCEFLYTNSTGKYSVMVLAVLWAYSFVYNFLKRTKYTKRNIWCFFISFIVLLYSNNTESIRYFLLLTTMIFWSKMELTSIEGFTHIIVILSSVMSVIQLLNGAVRTSGIFANSPTQMSCLLLVCLYYMLIIMVNKGIDKVNLICSCLCLPILFLTESRSTLAVGLVLFVLYLTAILIKRSSVSHKKFFFLLTVVPLIFIIMVYSSQLMNFILSKMNRTNNNASTMTRITIYKWLFTVIKENSRTFLFGKKGGFVELYLKDLIGSRGYFPAHQDFLLITCEYGIIGLLTIFCSFLYTHRKFVYFLIVYGVCSFHNILLTPTTMVFMVITLVDLERQNLKLWI